MHIAKLRLTWRYINQLIINAYYIRQITCSQSQYNNIGCNFVTHFTHLLTAWRPASNNLLIRFTVYCCQELFEYLFDWWYIFLSDRKGLFPTYSMSYWTWSVLGQSAFISNTSINLTRSKLETFVLLYTYFILFFAHASFYKSYFLVF